MAGNKFRKFREEKKSEEKKEEEEANSIKRNSNVMLTKDYTILLKAKEEQKYNSKYLFKKGTIIKVVDIIKNMGSIYLKFLMEKNDLTFGYIKEKDEKGIDNIKNIEDKKEEKKEKKIDKSKREICHSIRLGDAEKINTNNSPKSQEELNCEKRSKEFLDNIAIPLSFDKILNKNNEEEKDSTDISTTLDNGEYNLNNEKENNFGAEECFRDKKSKEEAVGKFNEKNKGNKKETKDVNPSEKFTLINANPRHRNGNNNSSNSISHLKKKLAIYYKLNKANSTYGQMLQNIQNSGQFGNKSDALIKIGELLFKKGYKKAFIAGLLANIYHEGNFGYFESSKYVKKPGAKPGYLKIMDEKYDYANKYSGKCVTQVSLKELKNLINELQNNNWKNGKFGLGVIQWTGGRTDSLVNLYLEVANGNDYINMDQVILAEGKMIISELNSNQYKNIYENWKENNNNDIDSENAAYDAGAKICQKYEIPYDTQNQAIKRGNTAKNIYRIMIQ